MIFLERIYDKVLSGRKYCQAKLVLTNGHEIVGRLSLV